MSDLCAICGIHPATTRDHIPPQNLYPKPRVKNINLNTVPACSHCNNGSSTDDEIFKVLIGIETGEHQAHPERIIESLAGTIGHNARIARDVFTTKQNVMANLNGEILQPAVSVTFDFEPYERVIMRIIRGLHWQETGQTLATEAKVQVFPGRQLSQSIASDWLSLMQMLPLKKLNKESFCYCCHIGIDGVHFWGMQFFSRHTTFALVHDFSAQSKA